jgi:hypothetical protein
MDMNEIATHNPHGRFLLYETKGRPSHCCILLGVAGIAFFLLGAIMWLTNQVGQPEVVACFFSRFGVCTAT